MGAATELLVDGYGRIREAVRDGLSGLTAAELAYRPDEGANSIGWLAWHLIRVQDDHVAAVAGREQVWRSGGWAERFALPFDESATGYGQTRREVAAVRPGSVDLLAGYLDAVHAATVGVLRGLTDGDFDRIVDEAWDPPVTLGVRLVSVLCDDLQHAGQIGYLRGLVQRRRAGRSEA
jgi:hypothetical protein